MSFPFDVKHNGSQPQLPADATTTRLKVARLKALSHKLDSLPGHFKRSAYKVSLTWHQTSAEFAGGVMATIASPEGYEVAIPLRRPETLNPEDATTNLMNQVQRFVEALQRWDRAVWVEETHWSDLEKLFED